MLVIFVTTLLVVPTTFAAGEYDKSNYKTLNHADKRDVIVHLQDWKYKDIEQACSKLNEIGYAAVQISPVTQYAVSRQHDYLQRLSVTTYRIHNDSGTEDELKQMVKTCHDTGISVLVDVVLNNMSRSYDTTQCGVNFGKKIYAVCHSLEPLYEKKDFHSEGIISIDDYKKNLDKIRNGELDGRHDLIQAYQEEGTENKVPNKKMVEFLSHLINVVKVDGFRILAADHMDPNDLLLIYNALPDVTHGQNHRPFIYSDVYVPEFTIGKIRTTDYVKNTRVTDYKVPFELTRLFLKKFNGARYLNTWETGWGLVNSEDSVIFVNNFITLQNTAHGIPKYPKLTDIDARVDKWITSHFDWSTDAYMIANLFILTHAGGIPLITSSYIDSNEEGGKKKFFNEHEFHVINQAIKLRNILLKENNGKFPQLYESNNNDAFTVINNLFNQIAYCVKDKGFVILNNEPTPTSINANLKTCFKSPGTYCDVYDERAFGIEVNENGLKKCKGSSITVGEDGKAQVALGKNTKAQFFVFYEFIPDKELFKEETTTEEV